MAKPVTGFAPHALAVLLIDPCCPLLIRHVRRTHPSILHPWKNNSVSVYEWTPQPLSFHFNFRKTFWGQGPRWSCLLKGGPNNLSYRSEVPLFRVGKTQLDFLQGFLFFLSFFFSFSKVFFCHFMTQKFGKVFFLV